MRKFMDIIAEATIPPTDYGYWISQFSEIYPVGDHGHENFIRAVEGCNSAEAIQDGWVRVVVSPGVFQAEACFPVLKPRVKAKVVLLARAEAYSQFLIDNYDRTGNYTINRYSTVHELIHGLEALQRQVN